MGSAFFNVARRTGLVLLLLLCLPLPIPAAVVPVKVPAVDDLLRQAEVAARKGDWLEACRCYDELFRRDRSRLELKPAYQHCLRQLHLVRRQRDPSYRLLVQRLSASQALDLYEQVLARIAATYVERGRTDVIQLFQHGVDELFMALADPVLLRDQFPKVSAAALTDFRVRLTEWSGRKVTSRTDAREQVLAITKAAQQSGLTERTAPLSAFFALEFACGACNALDEYTHLLTPSWLREAQAHLRGRFVGVGIDLNVVDQSLEIARVYPRSPAHEAGLLRRDRILRIDRTPIDQLAPETAADRLRGDVGSAVELEVVSQGQTVPHSVRLLRRPVVAPSVDHEVLDEGTAGLIGLIRIATFQETTPQELKETLAQLQTLGVRALILDLRGNSGGVFRAAVQAAEMFLGDGVIVHTQSQLREYNRSFRADLAHPVTLPLVVLVDGETASAAEVVAGALRDHERAVIVGQPTFGKGTVQCVLPLERSTIGLRITVARFFSPLRQAYANRGVHPDVAVPLEGEASLGAARQEARRLAALMMMPMPER